MLTGLLIIQHLLSKEDQVKVAKAILKSQDYYEDSFDKTFKYPKYTITHNEASLRACKELEVDIFWADCIANWNYYIWNEVQGWAQLTIKVFLKKGCDIMPQIKSMW